MYVYADWIVSPSFDGVINNEISIHETSENDRCVNDVNLRVAFLEDGLALHFQYNTEIFSEATIKRMADSFCHILDQIIESPLAPFSESLSVHLTKKEQEEIVQLSMGTMRPEFDEEVLIHQQFQKIAAADPDKPCLILGDLEMTYAEVKNLFEI